MTALLDRDGAAALEAVDRAAQAGEDLSLLCREVIESLRRILVLKVGPAGVFADLTPAEAEAQKAVGAAASVDELVYLLRAFLDADAEMRRSPHPRVELEIATVRATRRPEPQALDLLLSKVEDALGRLKSLPSAGVGPVAGARPAVVQESLLASSPAPAVGSRESLRTAATPVTSPRESILTSSPASVASPRPSEPAAERPRAASSVEPHGGGDLGDAWAKVVGEIMGKKALLGSVLEHATPLGLTDGILTLGLSGNHFHRELLADRANRELVNQVVQHHLPGVRRVEVDAGGGGGSGARSHPAVQAAMSVFQGEVVSVRPRAPEGGEAQ